LIGSLPVMNLGVFNMTRKQNARACSGKHRIHLGRKKNTHVSLAVQDRACVSSITRRYFSMNSLHKDKRRVNSYLGVLTRLRESVRRKIPGLWPNKWLSTMTMALRIMR
jgi:hypothetical protein